MAENKTIRLTNAAQERLEKALESYRQEILNVLEQEKFVPGEEVIEGTAADVDAIARRIKYGKTKRVELRRFYAQIFTLIGGLLLAAGLLYPQFKEISSNPVQMVLIVGGIYLGGAGLFLYRMISVRYSSKITPDDEDLRERIANLERLLREKREVTGEKK